MRFDVLEQFNHMKKEIDKFGYVKGREENRGVERKRRKRGEERRGNERRGKETRGQRKDREAAGMAKSAGQRCVTIA